MERVNVLLKELLSNILANDYNAGNDLVTLIDVSTTRDLSTALVIVNANSNLSVHIEALNARAREFQCLIKPQLAFKIIPRITFKADANSNNIERVEQILDSL